MTFVDALLARTEIPELELAMRLCAAVILGGLIGWDRESKNRPAGLRTHMLTSLASAVFAVVTLELMHWAVKNGGHADPVRAVEAVTAGVAFLAAGTIIQSRGRVVGLTTGAGMWLAGAVGVACGTGLFTIAVMVTALALIILMGLQSLSDKLSGGGNNPQTSSSDQRNQSAEEALNPQQTDVSASRNDEVR